MPTPFYRVQVVTVPPVRAALERISKAAGVPMGSIVRDFLEESLPALESMADALEMVPKSPGEALARMSRTLQETTANARQMGLELDQQATLLQRATKNARTAKRKAKKAARE